MPIRKCLSVDCFLVIATCFLSPTSLLLGMNKFLSGLEITFRRDSENFRPRINKLHSVKVSIILFLIYL